MNLVYNSIYVNPNNLSGFEIIKFYVDKVLLDEFNISDQCQMLEQDTNGLYDICPPWLQFIKPSVFDDVEFTLVNAEVLNILTFINTYYKTHDVKIIYMYVIAELQIKMEIYKTTHDFKVFSEKLQ